MIPVTTVTTPHSIDALILDFHQTDAFCCGNPVIRHCCLPAAVNFNDDRYKWDALFPRASPLQKQSTGLFLNSPLAEGF